MLNVRQGSVLEEQTERDANANAMIADEPSETVEQDNVITCSTYMSSSSDVLSVASVCARTEETSAATNVSGLAQTSKGVMIRPITTPSESNGKTCVFHCTEATTTFMFMALLTEKLRKQKQRML